MPILVIGRQPNGTPEQAAMFRQALGEKMLEAPGFIFHSDGPVDTGGYQIVDAWESRADFQRWFDTEVAPLMPPDAQAQTPPQIFELENVAVRR